MKSTAKNRKAQAFLNIEAISQGIIYTQDKYLIGFLSLIGNDNSLLRDEEHQLLTDRMANAMGEEQEPWQILAIPRVIDTGGMLKTLGAIETENPARQRLLQGEISELLRMEAEGVKEPMILLKLWTKATMGADKELIHRMEQLAARLHENQISAYRLSDEQAKYLCRVYAELGQYQPSVGEEPEDITLLAGQKRWVRERTDETAILLDELSPVGGFFFEKAKMLIGKTYLKAYGVIRYPSTVSYGWAAALTGATDTLTCITFQPGRMTELADALSKGAKRASREAGMENDLRQQKKYERQVQGASDMLDAIDSQGVTVGHMSITTLVLGQDEEDLAANCQRAISRFSSRRLTLKPLTNLQQPAYRHCCPYYIAQDSVLAMTQHIVPLATVMGGYPATVSTIRDDRGVYFARSMDGGILSIDLMLRDSDRTNGNGILIGTTGVGKSTVAKHLAQSMYMRGAKVIIIDPQREYKAMCEQLGGSWWDAGGGQAKANPLQVLNLQLDEGETDLSPMLQHMQALYIILRYQLPGLSDVQFELLKRVLREVYAQFGIAMDQTEFSADPQDYPTFSDVYHWLLLHKEENREYDTLALFLEDMAVGAEAQLWNGHTDMDMGNDFIVIDTSRLSDAPSTTQAAQYHNLLRLAYNQATQDSQPCVIIADEGHQLFNPTVPEAGSLVKKISKQIRKFEGCFWLVTQSLADMLHDQVSLYGQAVVDNSAYKVLMGCDGRNLEQATTLFHLNRAEQNLLETRQRGVALCLIGSRHLQAKFVLPRYKLSLMGTGGGR